MEFDFKELVAKAHFDYVGEFFPSWWNQNKTTFVLPSLKNIGANLLLGKPFFQVLKVKYKGDEFTFPNEPLISLRLQKTIVETATVGKERRGTVKEFINIEDYSLTIRGICYNTENPELYPTDEVENLQKLFEINESLELLENPFLLLFGIKQIVLKEIEWEEMRGVQGAQAYTISAISDQDFYADLTEKNKLL
jgi:hypothetical protein